MNISRLKRGALAALAVGLLMSLAVPSVANAASTAQFTISPSSGRPGDVVHVVGANPCPPISGGDPMASQDARISFVDSMGVSSAERTVTGTGTDGSWESDTYFPYPSFGVSFDPTKLDRDPAVGTGQVHVRCILPDGTVTQDYAPQPFTITARAYRMAGPSTTVQPGDVVHISSVDPCPDDRVNVSLFNNQVTSNFIATPDSNGVWSADVPASSEQMDGSRTPFPPGAYAMRAYCMSNETAKVHFAYADELLTVGSSTPTPVCNDALFIAAAGSGEHYNGDSDLSVSPELQKVYDGFRAVMPAGKKVAVQVLEYPALPVDVLFNKVDGVNLRSAQMMLEHNIPTYLNGKDAGVTALYEAVGHAHFTCPNEAIVLAGFSQGGMVVHQFLQEYAQTSGSNKNAIKAVVLVADPMRVANSQVFDFGTASSASYGVCQFVSAVVNCNGLVAVQDIPAMYQPLTTSICNVYDAVCDTSTLAASLWSHSYQAAVAVGTRVHTSYSSSPLTKTAGMRAGRQVMKGF